MPLRSRRRCRLTACCLVFRTTRCHCGGINVLDCPRSMAAAARSALSGDGPRANVLPISIVAIPHSSMSAGRVAVERFAERFFAGRKGEGMEERNAALETLLCFGRAGICKGDSAEFFARRTGHRCRGGLACGQRAKWRQKNKHKRKKPCAA